MATETIEQMSDTDLGEMLGIAYAYRDAGFQKIKIDTDHAIEILERLIASTQKEKAN